MPEKMIRKSATKIETENFFTFHLLVLTHFSSLLGEQKESVWIGDIQKKNKGGPNPSGLLGNNPQQVRNHDHPRENQREELIKHKISLLELAKYRNNVLQSIIQVCLSIF